MVCQFGCLGRTSLTRLPKRIYAKLLATQDMQVKYKPKVNNIIFLCMPYHKSDICRFLSCKFGMLSSCPCIMSTFFPLTTFRSSFTIKSILMWVVVDAFGHPPSQGDKSLKGEFFLHGSEAECRISFFAQSFMTEIPQPIPVDDMPTFMVLTAKR